MTISQTEPRIPSPAVAAAELELARWEECSRVVASLLARIDAAIGPREDTLPADWAWRHEVTDLARELGTFAPFPEDLLGPDDADLPDPSDEEILGLRFSEMRRALAA